ncbi:MAG: hypothetical protein GY854_06315 [Deltaproteobacteria bacterium]|nr:hypothetical protein [Deltaproteobacteria bacterium]
MKMRGKLALVGLVLTASISCGRDGGDDVAGDSGVGDSGAGVDTDSDTNVDSGSNDDGGPGLPKERPPTTVKQTIVGVLPFSAQKVQNRSEWGLFEFGPGEPHIALDGLRVGESAETPTGEPTSIAYFWHVTDSQIVDEESPARLINGEVVSQSAYRNQESWSVHFLEATIRTGNDLARFRAFDFAVLTGDMIDNIQRNEQEWFIRIMEGELVNPDSGDDDDPIPGEGNDQHDSFMAEGFARQIPWYTVLGNHDELIQGNFDGLSAVIVAKPTGTVVSALSAAVIPTCLDEPFFGNESLTPKRCYMPHKSYFNKKSVVADPERAYISRKEWIESFFGTETIPDGHGLTQDNIDSKTGYYAVDGVVPGVPSILIVLSTVSSQLADGTIGAPQLDWLKEQLNTAEAAGKMVIVASHHPLRTMANNAQTLTNIFNDHANVVMYVNGHTHENRIHAHPAPTGQSPEYGFWEIETSAIVDWPGQTRLIEIVDNRDGTGDIYCTMLDYQVPPDMALLKGGRFYALYDLQGGGGGTEPNGAPEDRNVRLRMAWPEDVAMNLEVLPNREIETLNF